VAKIIRRTWTSAGPTMRVRHVVLYSLTLILTIGQAVHASELSPQERALLSYCQATGGCAPATTDAFRNGYTVGRSRPNDPGRARAEYCQRGCSTADARAFDVGLQAGLGETVGAEDDETARLLDLASRSLADRAPAWRCEVTVRYICSAATCERREAVTWTVLDFAGARYQRCDGKGCDSFPLQHSAAGVYTTASPGFHRGLYLKVLNDGSEFVESASLGTTAYNNFGRCSPAR
jgi:hypothetical protein